MTSTTFCILLIAMVQLTLAELPSNCTTEICTTDFKPVCGRLEEAGQIIYRTFSNKCSPRNENCQHPQSPYIKHGVEGKTCKEQGFASTCSKVCYGLYYPVCGLHQQSGQKIYRTFSNDCEFWRTNCINPNNQFVQQGKLGQTCEDLGLSNVCSDACYALELPVCGLQESEGAKIYKTFANDCQLQQTNCRHPTEPFVQQGKLGQTCADLGLSNKCQPACNYVYEPRCAQRTLWFGIVLRRTFANNCLLVQHNCLYPFFAFEAVGEIGQTCRAQPRKL